MAKILVAELKGDKSFRKSILGGRLSSFAGSTREKQLEKEAEQEQVVTEEPDKILMDELMDKSTTVEDPVLEKESTRIETNEEEEEEKGEGEEEEEKNDEEEKQEGEEDEKEEEKGEASEKAEEGESKNGGGEEEENHSEEDDGEPKQDEASVDPTVFERLNEEKNTQRLFLENITMDEANQLSEAELKSSVFNALKTIEKLHQDLM